MLDRQNPVIAKTVTTRGLTPVLAGRSLGATSQTQGPASGAGAKGSPPGAVWLGRPALNCRVQSCSWSEAISSEALGRVYIPGMSIPFLGGMEQRQEQRNNIWTLVTCDQQHPPANGTSSWLGPWPLTFPSAVLLPPEAKPTLPQLQGRAGGRCYKCTSLSLALPPTGLWGAELRTLGTRDRGGSRDRPGT